MIVDYQRSKASIFRIIGNESVPRDAPGKRLALLEKIITQEPNFENTQKWFIVNRILDRHYHRNVCELLDKHNAHYITYYFDRGCEPNQISTRGINLNHARNAAIQAGKWLSDYTAVLDGDCMFDQLGWDTVYQDMVDGKYMHLSIPLKRENSDKLEEPQLVFRHDSPYKFDVSIPFGQAEKLKLLYLLGHSKENPHLDITGDLTKLSSYVNHLTTGDIKLEESLVLRQKARSQSLDFLASDLMSQPYLVSNIKGSLSNYFEQVPGWFSFKNVYANFALDMPENGHFVEVGSWLGKSAIYLALHFKALGKRIRIDCVDSWAGVGTDTIINDNIKNLGGSDAVFSTFMSHLYASQTDDIIRPVKMPSVEAAKLYADESLDCVFIDADHSYESVLSDIEAWYPKVKPGGIIAGHDFSFSPYTKFPGVVKAVLEFFKDKPLEIMDHDTVWKSVKYNGARVWL